LREVRLFIDHQATHDQENYKETGPGHAQVSFRQLKQLQG
jgi:hypothetical protein